MLFVVAAQDVAFCVLETAAPAGVGVFLAYGNLPFPQWVAHDEFLGHHAAPCLGLRVHVSVLIVAAQFLLAIAAHVLIGCIVCVKINRELPQFARIVEVSLMLRRIPFTSGSAVVEMVVGRVVGQQFVGIFIKGLHVVVGVLIEATERVAVVQLVVEACTSFKIWVARRRFVVIGDRPQRVGENCLFKTTAVPSLIVGSEEVGKELQPSFSVGHIYSLIVDVAVVLAAP